MYILDLSRDKKGKEETVNGGGQLVPLDSVLKRFSELPNIQIYLNYNSKIFQDLLKIMKYHKKFNCKMMYE